jgi:hypothetical protein
MLDLTVRAAPPRLRGEIRIAELERLRLQPEIPPVAVDVAERLQRQEEAPRRAAREADRFRDFRERQPRPLLAEGLDDGKAALGSASTASPFPLRPATSRSTASAA